MSLLWSNSIKRKPSNKTKKPSPTNQKCFPDSARNPESSLKGSRSRPFFLSRSIKGISLFTAFNRQITAGMTVEASIVLPLFLFFFLNLGCAIEMIRLHGNLQLALWQIGSKLSVYGYAVDSGEMPEGGEQAGEWWKDLAGIAFTSTVVKNRMINSAGKSYLDQSPITDGADGLQFWESKLFDSEDEINIVVTYSVSPWSSLMGFGSFRMANRYYAHIWNGYQLSVEETEDNKEVGPTVYVTETGSVYHLDRECTHIRLSIRAVPSGMIDQERNRSGSKYYPCEKCAYGDEPNIFLITDEGVSYHFDGECSGLKRTVILLTLDQALNYGYRPCSRCGNE